MQSWRHAYEKQVQEMETLKQQGTETALAAQWRRRYEKLSLEKVSPVLRESDERTRKRAC